MRKSSLTTMTRAYFALGSVLVVALFLTVGPLLASQTSFMWMAFGIGIAFIAFGRTNIRRQWLSIATMATGTIWIAALIFVIFGIADL